MWVIQEDGRLFSLADTREIYLRQINDDDWRVEAVDAAGRSTILWTLGTRAEAVDRLKSLAAELRAFGSKHAWGDSILVERFRPKA